jgi:hypothetical protein
MHTDAGIARYATLEFFENRHGIERGLGVGHAEDRGESASRCSLRARPDRFLPLLPGLPQVDVDIDPTRGYHQSIYIQGRLAGLGLEFADSSDKSIVQPDIGTAIKSKRWIDDVSTTEKGSASHDTLPRAEKNRLAALCGPGDGVAAASGLIVCATRSLV